MDLYATALSIAGATPNPEAVDAIDLSPALMGDASPRESLAFYRRGQLYAFRHGQHKIHLITEGAYGAPPRRVEHEKPLLFHLGQDPSERFDLSEQQPEVLNELLDAVASHNARMVPAEPVFDLGRD